jgi:hypothetical protein
MLYSPSTYIGIKIIRVCRYDFFLSNIQDFSKIYLIPSHILVIIMQVKDCPILDVTYGLIFSTLLLLLLLFHVFQDQTIWQCRGCGSTRPHPRNVSTSQSEHTTRKWPWKVSIYSYLLDTCTVLKFGGDVITLFLYRSQKLVEIPKLSSYTVLTNWWRCQNSPLIPYVQIGGDVKTLPLYHTYKLVEMSKLLFYVIRTNWLEENWYGAIFIR